MIVLKFIILGMVAGGLFIYCFYIFSKLQMRAWLKELDNFLNDKLDEYITKLK